MRKILLFFIIFILVLTTSFIKNSTKKIEDKIFIINENIRFLNKRLGDVTLEYNYLSSSEKLLFHKNEYFNNDLFQIKMSNIKRLSKKNGELIIENLMINLNK